MNDDIDEEAEGNNGQHWKQFQGTELGGLMAQIYGNENKPKINYPKFKTKPREQTQPYLPGGLKNGARDPRVATKQNVVVNVPKLGRPVSGESRGQYIPRRKQENEIKKEIDQMKMQRQYYRPGHTRATSTDVEKERLSQIFTYHGGKGLPEEMTHPVGKTAMELESEKKERERLQNVRNKYSKKAPVAVHKPELSNRELMAEQISHEIQERCEYLECLQDSGGDRNKIVTVKGEIASRVAELKKIESGL